MISMNKIREMHETNPSKPEFESTLGATFLVEALMAEKEGRQFGVWNLKAVYGEEHKEVCCKALATLTKAGFIQFPVNGQIKLTEVGRSLVSGAVLQAKELTRRPMRPGIGQYL